MGCVREAIHQLRPLIERSATCRREIASRGPEWDLLPEALEFVANLDEQVVVIARRAGLVVETRKPPPPASRSWRTAPAVLH